MAQVYVIAGFLEFYFAFGTLNCSEHFDLPV